MCRTSSARPQCTTIFLSTGTVSSSVCTLDTTARNTSTTSSSPNSCRYIGVFYAFVSLFHFSFLNILCDWLYLHYLHTVLRCLFLGAAVGACTPGICPKGQRQEWCHLCPGLQWHYVHYQTPRAHPFCGGEPCLGECCGSSDWYCNLSLKWD